MNTKWILVLVTTLILLVGSVSYFVLFQRLPEDFKIAIHPTAAILFKNATRNFTIATTSLGDTDSTINFTISKIPPEVSAIIEPHSLTLPANGEATSTLTVSGWNASDQPDTLIIEAVSEKMSRFASLTVRVVDLESVTRIAHWSYDGFRKFTIQDMVNKTLELGAQLAVVTLKDSYGNLYFGDFWNSNNETKINASLLVEQFHAQGIVVIGDIGGLHDPHWVATHNDSGLFMWNQTIGGYVRSDAWIEPYYVYADINGGRGYSQYIKGILNATLELGFDGVNFDDQLIYPYTDYTKPNSTFSGSPEFKDWAQVPQNYTGHERYFTQWNETDRQFFNKRADSIDLIVKEWVDHVKHLRPDAVTTVYLNPKDHIAHGVRLSTYSELFDAIYVQAYSSYVDFQSLNEIRMNISKPLYVFLYSLLGSSYPPIFFNDQNVMTEIADNAKQLKYEGIGIFTANNAYENGLENFVKQLFSNYVMDDNA